MRILFLCVANSARSQMAEGLARKIFGESAEILSAGSRPSFVHPLSIEVMGELDIDISKHSSKSVSDIDLSTVDRIITLCADEVCPYVPGDSAITIEHWPLSDPAKEAASEEQLAQFRTVRDELNYKDQGIESFA